MSVASINGSFKSHHTHNSRRPQNSDKTSREIKAKTKKESAPKSNPKDELLLSKPGKSHKNKVNNNITVDNNTTINNTTVNNATVNNDYGEPATTGGSDTGASGSEPTVHVVSPDLTEFNDRLDALTTKLDDLGSAVASFEQLALDFENRVGKYEQGEGPAIRGQLKIEGLSLSNITFALKFARQGFNVVDLFRNAGGLQQSDALGSISSSLNRSLASLKSQSQNLFAEHQSLSDLFSNNLGTALNKAV